MDSYHMQSRYSFCQGYPVNFTDPTGRSQTSAPAWVLGIAAGVIASILTCGLADIGFAALGASAVKVNIAASTIGSAAANVAEGAVSSAVSGAQYDRTPALRDLAIGAMGGLVGSGAGVAAASRSENTDGGRWRWSPSAGNHSKCFGPQADRRLVDTT